MKETRNILAAVFTLILVLAAGLYIGGEFFDVDMACLADASDSTRFVTQTTDILLSLAIVPTALWMFRQPRIHADLLARKADALRRWGLLRLLLLGLSLVGNTLLYYMFGFDPSFGYLAVITLLVMPFVVPTMSRCIAETSEVPEAPETPESPISSETPSE